MNALNLGCETAGMTSYEEVDCLNQVSKHIQKKAMHLLDQIDEVILVEL